MPDDEPAPEPPNPPLLPLASSRIDEAGPPELIDGSSAGIQESPTYGQALIQMIATAHDDSVINQAARDQYIQMLQVSDSRHLIPVPGSPTAQVMDELLLAFQPAALYPGLLARLKARRWVSVTGSAGSGKSTLLASLARPDSTQGQIPDEFIHAIVFCDATTTQESLAAELSGQLVRSIPGYLASLNQVSTSDWETFQNRPALERLVTLPLTRLFIEQDSEGSDPGQAGPVGAGQMIDLRDRQRASMPDQVRIVVDGLDQLRESDAAELIPALAAMTGTDDLARFRVIAGHRAADLKGLPEPRGTLPIETRPAGAIARYLSTRGLATDPSAHLADLCTRADSAWLAARLIADIYTNLDPTGQRHLDRLLADTSDRKAAITWLYNQRLATLPGWTNPQADTSPAGLGNVSWTTGYLPVLTALVATGSGPVAPLSLLAAVSAKFGGPETEDGVRTILDRLERLVIHTDPRTDRELAGLFHPTLIEHLSRQPFDPNRRQLDITSGTRVLLDEIDRLTPKTGLYIDNPLFRWATEAQAEHAWQFGMPKKALEILRDRPLPTPSQNLERWTTWWPRIMQRFGPQSSENLSARGNIAAWTGQAGDTAGALRLSQELLPDRQAVMGPLHPDTLATRSNIASWTGEAGDAAGALHLFQELLPDQQAVLGPRHPNTLATRHNIASWTGEAGDAAGALHLFQELLPDQQAVLGPRHPNTLSARGNIASWTGRAGDAAGALHLSQELLPDRQAVLGPRHPNTLATRHNIASWTGRAGDAAGALRLFQELLPDQQAVLGPLHPDTLATRSNIASWTGEAGDAAGALRLSQELLPDRQAVLGPRHPNTLTTRSNIASWTGEAGDDAGALHLFQELLPDQQAVLGPRHPDTLATRHNIATLQGPDISDDED